MDKIIWLDGHTSKQYTENGNWHMKYAGSTFVWVANCWMEI